MRSQPGAQPPTQLTLEGALTTLRRGQIQERGLLPYSSNYSFLVLVDDGKWQLPGVYKPQRGENPLWDFPTGTLCHRETAAFAVSAALGWLLVPPTVLREGTRGLGSVQLFIDCHPDSHYFSMREDARYARSFRQVALFDAIINNADRKSGHCLFGVDQRLWAIDHGICFHAEYKLRTVIWEFSGQPIEDDLRKDLAALQEQLEDLDSALNMQLMDLLSFRECTALRRRVGGLLAAGCYPSPRPHQRNFPWPPI